MTPTHDTRQADWIDSLDPTLCEAAQGYLKHLLQPLSPSSNPTSSELNLRAELQEQIKLLPSPDDPMPLPIIAMVTLFVTFFALRSAPPFVGFTLLTIGLLIGCWSFAQQENRKLSNEKSKESILNTALPVALSYVTRTRNEKAYQDAVRELLPSTRSSEDYLSSELWREQMKQLNTLLESGRQLDAIHDEIVSAVAAASLETLRSEVDALRQREERATDPGTRAAFAQSRVLCEERLRRAEVLYGMTERVEAEQELVYQAFRAAQSSIASLRLSPTAAGLDRESGSASVAEIAETISRQTRAVEEAVQELGIRH